MAVAIKARDNCNSVFPQNDVLHNKSQTQMYKIGLTGCIGSGKSTILNWLSTSDEVRVLKVDEIAKGLFAAGSQTYHDIVSEFADHSILDSAGEVDRRKLGSLAFSDDHLLAKLNGVCFPFLYHRLCAAIREIEQNGGGKVLVVEAGILF
jgi:dephospho-CoA kinase